MHSNKESAAEMMESRKVLENITILAESTKRKKIGGGDW